ncbi:bifunctional tetrahydrofolate synthase/dihydrofolate synthase [Stenotrophomonas sp. Sa5BUN4]|uniref:Dihydrofolate synthase/folylpolyglutamate synthase n=1 Tax=Stenotrophomonas lacuserhaii TaxID=2760084 RepID=A0A8X8FV81_9GAMM|nr:bifunctional tetrahydrofolate synthase/dihydrofolate synthase [Stenotrophomonas pennii]MBD7955907.1 bifunctional tetrahydrofolate synthase/dihydrofolate synthase [Stenotrophomonas pennii]
MTALPTTLSDWLVFIERQHSATIDMGLERVRTVATALQLGAPAQRTITVGGTNGKGSTVAFVEAIARAAGWKVGAYTSPHLLRYNERVRINGEEASDEALVAAFSAVEAARGDTTLTYFEYGTLAAFYLFAQAGLDLAVLEVGLGGRLDAVNLIDADVAVITTVDIDHADWLGADRESIGTEKAGILRGWKPAVLGEIDPPSSVLRRAYLIGANAIRAGSDYFNETLDAQTWAWRDVAVRLELPMPSLAGPVQLANAGAAIAALRSLELPPGCSLPRAAYAEGIAAARIDGRLQCFQRDGINVLVDVGHNPQAAAALARALQAEPVSGRTLAVYAGLQDKDAAGVVQALGEAVSEWTLAGLEGPRGQDAATLAARLAGTVAADASQADTVAHALAQVLTQAVQGDRVLVFGSFHTAAEALAWLQTAA